MRKVLWITLFASFIACLFTAPAQMPGESDMHYILASDPIAWEWFFCVLMVSCGVVLFMDSLHEH